MGLTRVILLVRECGADWCTVVPPFKVLLQGRNVVGALRGPFLAVHINAIDTVLLQSLGVTAFRRQ